MRFSKILGGVGFAGVVVGTICAVETHANACGGCFHPPTETPTVVTDHRMIFSVSTAQTTLYDQIKYSGNPADFAWVLPISSTVTVGISADVVFSALDQQTQTAILAPPQNCPPPPQCAFSSSASSSGGFGGPTSADAGVIVLKSEVVGPYETKQLHPVSPNDTALTDYLTANNYAIPADVLPIIQEYQKENFNFLVMRLKPGSGVQDMRPVSVSAQGAGLALPLRMVAAGTGPTVGITLWVVGQGRYEPQGGAQGFSSFSIGADELTWDWTQQRSNYTELRAQKTQAANGRAWEIENSTIVYRQQIEGIVQQGTYSGQGPFPQTDEERAEQDYLPATDDQGTVTKTALQVRNADMDTLFYGIATSQSRITRLRADLAHASLNADLVLQASADQAVLPRERQVTKSVNEPACQQFPACPPDESSSGQASSSGSSSGSTSSGGVSSGGSTFTCASTSSSSPNTWMGIGLGFGALAIAQLIRRRSRK